MQESPSFILSAFNFADRKTTSFIPPSAPISQTTCKNRLPSFSPRSISQTAKPLPSFCPLHQFRRPHTRIAFLHSLRVQFRRPQNHLPHSALRCGNKITSRIDV